MAVAMAMRVPVGVPMGVALTMAVTVMVMVMRAHAPRSWTLFRSHSRAANGLGDC